MDRHRIDPTHALTPRIYPCPACARRARMRIVWPFWHCPHCNTRLIPADLYPAGTPAGPAPQNGNPGLDARPPSASELPVPSDVRAD